MKSDKVWSVNYKAKVLMKGYEYELSDDVADEIIVSGNADMANSEPKKTKVTLVEENKAVESVEENKEVEAKPKRRGRKAKK